MAWVKIDDKFYDHPKWADAPGDSIALWLASMAWCNRNDSFQGYIPAAKLVGLVNVKNPKRTAEDLCDRDAFEAADGGYIIHDYAEYQQPEKVQRIREQRAESGRKGAASRWQVPSGLPSGLPKQTARQSARQTDGPLSDPVDDEESSSVAPVVTKALAIVANRLAEGKKNPGGYAAKIIENAHMHTPQLESLLWMRPDCTHVELADAYRDGGWTDPPAPTHPDTCVCGGTGVVLVDPDDESRTAPVTRCTVTEWPDATIHHLRGASAS